MWIDVVFSGGGVKAFAFAGAIEVLEKAGYRFKRLGGTSAGAIVAALLAAGYTSDEIKKHMEALEPALLLDRKADGFRFPFFKWLKLYWRMGLFSGNAFEKWMKQLLLAKGVDTFADLPSGALSIIVSDISRGEMVVLPDNLDQYGIDPNTFSVARAVRMSCSLPFFFEPIALYNQKGEKCLMIDGGILSNFPLWLFDSGDALPERPFLGLQLSNKSEVMMSRKIKNAIELFRGLFTTMREAHDAKYISKYKTSNIIFIPVNHVETADFGLSKEERERLAKIGKEKAERFLKKWTY